MIRGIFFDLYGTLFIYGDMKKAWAEWLHHFHISLRELGLTLSEEDFSKRCERFFGKDEPDMTEQNLTVFEKRIKFFCSSLEVEASDEDIVSIADLIAGKWQEEIELDEDAIPVLKELRKDKILGLVSNFDHPRHVRRYLSEYGLDHLFETIIISGEVGVKKPDPDIFRPALSATGLMPGEVAYVGDSGVDIEAASAAGIMPVLIKRQNEDAVENGLDFRDDSRNEMKAGHSQSRIRCKTISTLREILCV